MSETPNPSPESTTENHEATPEQLRERFIADILKNSEGTVGFYGTNSFSPEQRGAIEVNLQTRNEDRKLPPNGGYSDYGDRILASQPYPARPNELLVASAFVGEQISFTPTEDGKMDIYYAFGDRSWKDDYGRTGGASINVAFTLPESVASVLRVGVEADPRLVAEVVKAQLNTIGIGGEIFETLDQGDKLSDTSDDRTVKIIDNKLNNGDPKEVASVSRKYGEATSLELVITPETLFRLERERAEEDLGEEVVERVVNEPAATPHSPSSLDMPQHRPNQSEVTPPSISEQNKEQDGDTTPLDGSVEVIDAENVDDNDTDKSVHSSTPESDIIDAELIDNIKVNKATKEREKTEAKVRRKEQMRRIGVRVLTLPGINILTNSYLKHRELSGVHKEMSKAYKAAQKDYKARQREALTSDSEELVDNLLNHFKLGK